MVGVFFILPQLTFLAIVIIFCPITLDDISGCVINYPHFLPWYWLGVAAPINAFFSAVFSYIAYRQYRLYGSDAWKRLARDGIQTMCLVVLCNVVCGICIIFKVGGNFSEMFFLADWSLNSTILVQHCSSMRRVKSLSNSKKSAETPKTSQSRKSNTIPTTKDLEKHEFTKANSTSKRSLCSLLNLHELGVRSSQSVFASILRRRAELLHACDDIEMRRGYSTAVTTLAIETAEHRYLLSGSISGTVGLHDLQVNDKIDSGLVRSSAIIQSHSSNSHKRAVTSVCWYPFDTGMFTSSSFDGKIKVWDTNEMKAVTEFDLKDRIYTHTPSSISSQPLIAAATDHTQVRLCDLRTGDCVHSLTGHKKSVMSVAWSPSKDYLLMSGGQDGRVFCWDVRKSNSVICSLNQYNSDASKTANANRAHRFAVNGLAFTPDGRHLISTGHDERIRLWNVQTFRNEIVNYGSLIRNQVNQTVTPLIVQDVVSQPPLLFHASNDRQILQYDLFSGKLINQLKGSYNRIYSLVWRPIYQELFVGGDDYDILVWSPTIRTATHKPYTTTIKQAAMGTNVVVEEEANGVDTLSSDAWSDEEDNSNSSNF
ncbi:WD40-repeat-containing domain protein [Syncephalis fuscata]|nr:WD40-repeat-containing domain protein [Syncephalis fuscata]